MHFIQHRNSTSRFTFTRGEIKFLMSLRAHSGERILEEIVKVQGSLIMLFFLLLGDCE